MLQFGQPLPGRTHVDRPAAFGIAERDGKIAAVRIRPANGGDWVDLPGGAVDPGEDELQAVVREFGEEAGLVIAVEAPVITAAQYFVKSSDGQAVNNRGSIYRVTLVAENASLKIEDDHELVWLDPNEAVRRLRHDSHAWAVAKWLRGNG